jgi:hypothetical protein
MRAYALVAPDSRARCRKYGTPSQSRAIVWPRSTSTGQRLGPARPTLWSPCRSTPTRPGHARPDAPCAPTTGRAPCTRNALGMSAQGLTGTRRPLRGTCEMCRRTDDVQVQPGNLREEVSHGGVARPAHARCPPAAVTAPKLDQTDAPQALCHAEIVINCVKQPILKRRDECVWT